MAAALNCWKRATNSPSSRPCCLSNSSPPRNSNRSRRQYPAGRAGPPASTAECGRRPASLELIHLVVAHKSGKRESRPGNSISAPDSSIVGEIPITPVPRRQCGATVRSSAPLRPRAVSARPAAFFRGPERNSRILTAELKVQIGQRFLAVGIHKQTAGLVEKIVAGRAGDRPGRGQGFARLQNLLDNDPGIRREPA